MELKEKIKKDSILARKNKKEIEYSTLNYLLALILNKEKEKRFNIVKKQGPAQENIDKKSQLTDDEIVDLIFSEIKKRKESQGFFKRGKRDDLVQKEEGEIKVLEKYIPPQLTDDEIEGIVKEIIDRTGANSLKDMGKTMGLVIPKIKGRADGLRVSEIVKKSILEKSCKPE